MKTTNLKQLQNKVEREFELNFRYENWGCNKLQRKIIRKGVETWINATDKQVLNFILSKLKEAYNAGRDGMIETIKEVFNDWGGESQYVTGSWNSGEELDSDRKGDKYWDWWSKTAWEQFYDMLQKKLSINQKES